MKFFTYIDFYVWCTLNWPMYKLGNRSSGFYEAPNKEFSICESGICLRNVSKDLTRFENCNIEILEEQGVILFNDFLALKYK